MIKVEDRAIGCLAGLMAGDVNGGPTAMMMKNLETIVCTRTLVMQNFGKGYLEWFKEGGVDASLVTQKVLELVNSGLTFNEAVKQIDKELDGMTAGISPAHRSIPLTLHYVAWYLRSPNFFVEFPNTGFREFEYHIGKEARLTHLHNEASQVSQAVNAICMYLILGKDIVKSIEFGMNFLKTDWSENFLEYIDSLTINDLSDGGYAPDVLVAALWFLMNNGLFEDALEQSKAFAGAANYCPILVGSIGGAMNGYEKIKSQIKDINEVNFETITTSVNSIFNRVAR